MWVSRGSVQQDGAVVLHRGVRGLVRAPAVGKQSLWQGPSNCWVLQSSSVPLLMLAAMYACFAAVGFTDSGITMLVHSTISKPLLTAGCVGWVVHNYSLVALMLLTWSVGGVMVWLGSRGSGSVP